MMGMDKGNLRKKTPEELLILLMEECGEVIQESSKIIRFGWDERWPRGAPTNQEKLYLEVNQVIQIIEVIREKREVSDG